MSWQPPSESSEQKTLVKWAKMRSATIPELQMLISIPNGGKRDPITGAILKQEGTARGFPDMFLFVPRHPWHGLAIELKRQKGGRTSKYQKDWLDLLQTRGYRAFVAHGAWDAITIIEKYLSGDTA